MGPRNRKHQLSDTSRGETIGGDAARRRIDRRACREGGVKRRRLLGLDRHDARPAGAPGCHATDQAAAADCNQHRVNARCILLQLHSDTALTEQGLDLVVGMHRHGAGLRDMGFACGERVGIAAARNHEFRAIASDTLGFGRRGDVGHEIVAGMPSRCAAYATAAP